VRSGRHHRWLLLADLAWMAVAAWLAHCLRSGHFRAELTLSHLAGLVPPVVVCSAVWLTICTRMSLDRLGRYSKFPEMFSRVMIAVTVFFGFILALAFMVRNLFSRLAFIYFGVLLVVGFTVIRGIARYLALRFRSEFAVRTVIIGSGRIATEIANKITAHPEHMRDLVGFLHAANSDLQDSTHAGAVGIQDSLSSVKALDLLQQLHVEELILAGAESTSSQTSRLVAECRKSGIAICVVPESYELYSSHARVIDLEGLPLVKVEQRVPTYLDLALKRASDVVLAVPLFVFTLPLTLLAAVTIVVRGRKPFSSEPRCGRDGKLFSMFRLNIPRHAEDLSGSDLLLDRMSVTELPQLWNVLRGEMSVVGPRPESEERVKRYSEWQRQRLAMKPGLTGLAQVQGLRDEHSSDEKARYDLQYIHDWSPFLDLSLILQTLWTVAVRVNSPAVQRIPHEETTKVIPIPAGDQNVDRAQSGAD
jgi:lipopolysaccharide/colanic/teichoic acid biosynthesis glycosyltransferase